MHSGILRLSSAVRWFTQHGALLSWDFEKKPAIAAGSTVNVEEPREFTYDHTIKTAVPFDCVQEETGFILLEELSPADQDQLRVIFPGNPLLTVH
ncbi:MAG: hypothetical protein A3J09_02220 [Candidatus Zambryskibacteria bacterium RIFCSPLOWO2_02_FULL_51_21]|uniref:Uncharacterized protein n=1 Tax=Candidatus Zambryskibacteria bacterium RIFCSPHIGHO2_02_FULL_43_37 TaxID=1802749 RepID=A0A1G2TIE8_9BACT|nr:MAG: hypothetical protein A2723_02220 [Candidatus Zambryskibacteria bacterium RIFCSPHIGHO2_01_FULL_52_18]OHA96391.1 MAG: hypothetical protein A3D49_00680 [Candidatus Zambryskibacteria bacterium RIFCSPHIGHO2_02_FULL_43_37]OHB07790.1 MAG: hypothetical protein A2944_00540 [Candidatus Zambryskibacteria bacterium RIFCSPLOWO2_01_FULL_52_12]OHB11349.1 MAG: hypothetical protein A3J09_02220 [Candidatus Zambryskibacteria bacterium RIFCSPLOWO2_02_FULL_51_21]